MSWNDFTALAEGQPPVEVFNYVPNRFSYLAHIGGMTGEPKGVMLSDDALNGVADEYNALMEHKRQERYLNTMPILIGNKKMKNLRNFRSPGVSEIFTIFTIFITAKGFSLIWCFCDDKFK